jgi:hypothetical protein
VASRPRGLARSGRSWPPAASSSLGTTSSAWACQAPGKTPLALALGLQAVQQRYRTRCTAAMSRIAALTTADAETRLEERRKHDSLPKLLIIDERGSIPIAQHGAHRFFQLISRRYERGSIGLTSNQSFGQGGRSLGLPASPRPSWPACGITVS